MASLVEAAECESDELVFLLIHCLPLDRSKLWNTAEDILEMLRAGGITSYNDKLQIGKLLRAQRKVILTPNNTNKIRYI